ncbi:MAG: PRC-barrel domain-containing protein [Atopobiaceae bacterium]|nr:PRC-barrel domain-containing protein [Atopobiaceae bacterium]MBR3315838.1 PRC-barrel domain-containing protein [Atopobiaceae bacterium]
MLRVSQLMRVPVHVPKKGRKGDPRELAPADLSNVGEVHQVVFSPAGNRVVGYLVRRPDVGGMIKREDAFVALDACVAHDAGLVVTGDAGMDDDARARLGLDWNACLIWTGMDAKTSDGKELGWVSDVEFHSKSGRVSSFYVGDGGVATSLVGNLVIPADMLLGYRDGYMIVEPEAANLQLNGGLAAKAGEGYAKAKVSGRHVAAKVGKVTEHATEQGARNLGKMLGKAKKQGKKRIGQSKGMFGAFLDEYKKASK